MGMYRRTAHPGGTNPFTGRGLPAASPYRDNGPSHHPYSSHSHSYSSSSSSPMSSLFLGKMAKKMLIIVFSFLAFYSLLSSPKEDVYRPHGGDGGGSVDGGGSGNSNGNGKLNEQSEMSEVTVLTLPKLDSNSNIGDGGNNINDHNDLSVNGDNGDNGGNDGMESNGQEEDGSRYHSQYLDEHFDNAVGGMDGIGGGSQDGGEFGDGSDGGEFGDGHNTGNTQNTQNTQNTGNSGDYDIHQNLGNPNNANNAETTVSLDGKVEEFGKSITGESGEFGESGESIGAGEFGQDPPDHHLGMSDPTNGRDGSENEHNDNGGGDGDGGGGGGGGFTYKYADPTLNAVNAVDTNNTNNGNTANTINTAQDDNATDPTVERDVSPVQGTAEKSVQDGNNENNYSSDGDAPPSRDDHDGGDGSDGSGGNDGSDGSEVHGESDGSFNDGEVFLSRKSLAGTNKEQADNAGNAANGSNVGNVGNVGGLRGASPTKFMEVDSHPETIETNVTPPILGKEHGDSANLRGFQGGDFSRNHSSVGGAGGAGVVGSGGTGVETVRNISASANGEGTLSMEEAIGEMISNGMNEQSSESGPVTIEHLTVGTERNATNGNGSVDVTKSMSELGTNHSGEAHEKSVQSILESSLGEESMVQNETHHSISQHSHENSNENGDGNGDGSFIKNQAPLEIPQFSSNGDSHDSQEPGDESMGGKIHPLSNVTKSDAEGMRSTSQSDAVDGVDGVGGVGGVGNINQTGQIEDSNVLTGNHNINPESAANHSDDSELYLLQNKVKQINAGIITADESEQSLENQSKVSVIDQEKVSSTNHTGENGELQSSNVQLKQLNISNNELQPGESQSSENGGDIKTLGDKTPVRDPLFVNGTSSDNTLAVENVSSSSKVRSEKVANSTNSISLKSENSTETSGMADGGSSSAEILNSTNSNVSESTSNITLSNNTSESESHSGLAGTDGDKIFSQSENGNGIELSNSELNRTKSLLEKVQNFTLSHGKESGHSHRHNTSDPIVISPDESSLNETNKGGSEVKQSTDTAQKEGGSSKDSAKDTMPNTEESTSNQTHVEKETETESQTNKMSKMFSGSLWKKKGKPKVEEGSKTKLSARIGGNSRDGEESAIE